MVQVWSQAPRSRAHGASLPGVLKGAKIKLVRLVIQGTLSEVVAVADNETDARVV